IIVTLRETGLNTLEYRATVAAGILASNSAIDRVMTKTDTDWRLKLYWTFGPTLADSVMVAIPNRAVQPSSTAAGTDTIVGRVLGDTFWLTVTDFDANADSETVDYLTVVVGSTTGDSEIVTLTELGPDSGVFRGPVTTDTAAVAAYNGVLNGDTAADTIQIHYVDTEYAADSRWLAIYAVGRTWARIDFTDSDGDSISAYNSGDTVYIRVVDHDANLDRGAQEQYAVELFGNSGDYEGIWLYETGLSADTFAGIIPLRARAWVSGNNVLEALVGGSFRALYSDSNDTMDTAAVTAAVANSPALALAANITGADSGVIFAGWPEVIVTRYSDADTVTDLDTVCLRIAWAHADSSVTLTGHYGSPTVLADSSAKLRTLPAIAQSVSGNVLTCTWTFRYGWQFDDTTAIAYGVVAYDTFGASAGWSFTDSFVRYENDLTCTGTLAVAGKNGTVVEDTWVRSGDTLNYSGLSFCYEGSAIMPDDTGVVFYLGDMNELSNVVPQPLNWTRVMVNNYHSGADDTVTIMPGTFNLQSTSVSVVPMFVDTFVVWVDGDSPHAFATFAAGSPGAVSMPLTWTATDDVHSGFKEYRIYYAVGDSATLASASWGPGNDAALGNKATAATTITGLTAGTTYYFLLTATDAVGNVRMCTTQVTAATAGALDHFTLVGPGTAYEMLPYTINTITAQDSGNLTVDNFASAVLLTCTPGSVSPDTSGSFTAGVLN
ncbi:MAG TPA: fibronectin type III domain-containing protein, partial [bacterium]|nr:fibronectin type III domain-containing protein [bacterium]